MSAEETLLPAAVLKDAALFTLRENGAGLLISVRRNALCRTAVRHKDLGVGALPMRLIEYGRRDIVSSATLVGVMARLQDVSPAAG
ncbi:hypothetical protein [Streptomyces sp. NPDC012510]|uniref:hypothetical protein n=1 Tax=Streptomyces sp. NPDC012510 TaxID=3364838 RepID=UPI0036EA7F50